MISAGVPAAFLYAKSSSAHIILIKYGVFACIRIILSNKTLKSGLLASQSQLDALCTIARKVEVVALSVFMKVLIPSSVLKSA